jgi:hypothetical protein
MAPPILRDSSETPLVSPGSFQRVLNYIIHRDSGLIMPMPCLTALDVIIIVGRQLFGFGIVFVCFLAFTYIK